MIHGQIFCGFVLKFAASYKSFPLTMQVIATTTSAWWHRMLMEMMQ
jgi:hypothetical protein